MKATKTQQTLKNVGKKAKTKVFQGNKRKKIMRINDSTNVLRFAATIVHQRRQQQRATINSNNNDKHSNTTTQQQKIVSI